MGRGRHISSLPQTIAAARSAGVHNVARTLIEFCRVGGELDRKNVEENRREWNFGSMADVLRAMKAFELVLPEPPSPLGEVRRFFGDGILL